MNISKGNKRDIIDRFRKLSRRRRNKDWKIKGAMRQNYIEFRKNIAYVKNNVRMRNNGYILISANARTNTFQINNY